MRKFVLALSILTIAINANSQDYSQDINHYKFELELSPINDSIKVSSKIKGTKSTDRIIFHLADNMHISEIRNSSSEELRFERFDDVVTVFNFNMDFNISVKYSGIPQDGLIIGKNKYNNNTYFGDNWPNRARYWLSVYDHPKDKATVEFVIKAPKGLNVVANGKHISSIASDSFTSHTYSSSNPIPTKVMVLGAAKFSTQVLQKQPYVIASFVYPEDEMEAFYDYAITPKIVKYYESLFGKYPFDKLYNVQSTTRYGGMENAGCIFYDENAIDGKRSNEDLIAHEIAHQWFGNTVSEKDWRDLWLSEGFASYFENVYMEKEYGEIKMIEIMKEHKESVLKYKNTHPNAVLVPEEVLAPINMLNPYSYKKGAWVLHMLRSELGDEQFFKSIEIFYKEYKYKNASTKDFIKSINKSSSKELNNFFKPWLYNNILPSYSLKWTIEGSTLKVRVKQLQLGETFYNTIPIEVKYDNNFSEILRIEVDSKEVNKTFEVEFNPKEVILDPNNYILKL